MVEMVEMVIVVVFVVFLLLRFVWCWCWLLMLGGAGTCNLGCCRRHLDFPGIFIVCRRYFGAVAKYTSILSIPYKIPALLPSNLRGARHSVFLSIGWHDYAIPIFKPHFPFKVPLAKPLHEVNQHFAATDRFIYRCIQVCVGIHVGIM